MNASIPLLAREEEVQSKIRKIRAFGSKASAVCSMLYGFGLIVCLILLIVVPISVFGPREPEKYDGGLYDVLMSPRTPVLFKLFMFSVTGLALSAWLAIVYQLRLLFGNLADGAIHTAENVRCVRNVGYLWLLLTALGIAIPTALTLARPLIDASVTIDIDRASMSLNEILLSLAAVGLILLVSWIMDVGLYEKEHADKLRTEADLTI